jgi:hypothetical protein
MKYATAAFIGAIALFIGSGGATLRSTALAAETSKDYGSPPSPCHSCIQIIDNHPPVEVYHSVTAQINGLNPVAYVYCFYSDTVFTPETISGNLIATAFGQGQLANIPATTTPGEANYSDICNPPTPIPLPQASVPVIIPVIVPPPTEKDYNALLRVALSAKGTPAKFKPISMLTADLNALVGANGKNEYGLNKIQFQIAAASRQANVSIVVHQKVLADLAAFADSADASNISYLKKQIVSKRTEIADSDTTDLPKKAGMPWPGADIQSLGNAINARQVELYNASATQQALQIALTSVTGGKMSYDSATVASYTSAISSLQSAITNATQSLLQSQNGYQTLADANTRYYGSDGIGTAVNAWDAHLKEILDYPDFMFVRQLPDVECNSLVDGGKTTTVTIVRRNWLTGAIRSHSDAIVVHCRPRLSLSLGFGVSYIPNSDFTVVNLAPSPSPSSTPTGLQYIAVKNGSNTHNLTVLLLSARILDFGDYSALHLSVGSAGGNGTLIGLSASVRNIFFTAGTNFGQVQQPLVPIGAANLYPSGLYTDTTIPLGTLNLNKPFYQISIKLCC